MVRTISNDTADESTIEEVLNFYNMATRTILDYMASEIGKAQSSHNWRPIMTSFNMIKIIESTGIGLVFGLRYYGNGMLKENEMIIYVQHNGLLLEYYRKSTEVVSKDIKPYIDDLYGSRELKVLIEGSKPILANAEIQGDYKKGLKYFEECRTFIRKTLKVMDVLRQKIAAARDTQLYAIKLGNMWGIFILIIILLISPLLLLLAKNVISTFQMFAASLSSRSRALRKQKLRQDRLVFKMLPEVVVTKIKKGKDGVKEAERALKGKKEVPPNPALALCFLNAGLELVLVTEAVVRQPSRIRDAERRDRVAAVANQARSVCREVRVLTKNGKRNPGFQAVFTEQDDSGDLSFTTNPARLA